MIPGAKHQLIIASIFSALSLFEQVQHFHPEHIHLAGNMIDDGRGSTLKCDRSSGGDVM